MSRSLLIGHACFATNPIVHGLSADAEHGPDCHKGLSAGLVDRDGFDDISVGDGSACVSFAPRPIVRMRSCSVPIPSRLASLGSHIVHVLSLCPRPKMITPAAWAVVAGVQGEWPVTRGESAVCQKKGNSIRADKHSPYLESSIAARVCAECPDPTLAFRSVPWGLVYAGPEAVNVSLGHAEYGGVRPRGGTIGGKHRNLLSGGPLGGETPRGAFLLPSIIARLQSKYDAAQARTRATS